MGLSSGEILDIINIVYYIPALVAAGIIGSRHGLRKSNGWLYLIPLAIFRIVGSILGILAVKNKDKTMGEVAAILSSAGLSLLIQAALGLLRRLNECIHKGYQFPPKYIDLLVIPILVAVGFAIKGGTTIAKGDANSYHSGQTGFKVAGVLFLLAVAAMAVLVVMSAQRRQYLPSGESRLIIAAGLCVPVFFVRVIYVLCIGCASQGSTTFNVLAPDVAVEGVMSSAPEFISVAILLVFGFTVRKAKDVAKVGPPPNYNMVPEEGNKYQTYPSPQQQQPWAPTPPRQAHAAQHYQGGRY